MVLTEVKISHMKTGRKFSVILSVFSINPNTTFERKQRALDGTQTGFLRIYARVYTNFTYKIRMRIIYAILENVRIAYIFFIFNRPKVGIFRTVHVRTTILMDLHRRGSKSTI